MKYKVLSLFITLTMIIGLISTIPIVTASNDSGTCGKNATWSFDYNTNTLTISGTGDMDNYIDNDMPWYYLITYRVIDIVVINNGVTNIGNYSFCGCDNLTSVTIPNSVTNIGDYAFNCCFGLKNLTIPSSVKTLGNAAFRGCTNLTNVTLSEGITNIGNQAFENCYNLKSISIPNSVTSIGKDVFANCNNPVINCYSNSYAEQYAKVNGITAKITKTQKQVFKDKKAAQKTVKKVTQVTVKSKSKKKINVTWKKINKAKGYEVQVSKKKNFKKPVYDKFTKKTNLTIKKLKSKKTYFVRVRAYATYNDVNNDVQNVYGSWSKKTGKKIKVK